MTSTTPTDAMMPADAQKKPGVTVWLTNDEAGALKRLVAEFLAEGGRMDGDDDAAAAAFANQIEQAAAALNDPDAVVEMVVSDSTLMVHYPAPPDTAPGELWAAAPTAGNDAADQIARTLSAAHAACALRALRISEKHLSREAEGGIVVPANPASAAELEGVRATIEALEWADCINITREN